MLSGVERLFESAHLSDLDAIRGSGALVLLEIRRKPEKLRGWAADGADLAFVRDALPWE